MSKEPIYIYTSGRFTTIGRFKSAKAPRFRDDGTKEKEHHFIKTPGSFKTKQVICYEPDLYWEGRLINDVTDIGDAGERVRIFGHDILGNSMKDFLPFELIQENDRLKAENRRVKVALNDSVRKNIELTDTYEKKINALKEQVKELRGAFYIPPQQEDGNQ